MGIESTALHNGVEVGARVSYTPTESRGPLALAVTAGISLCAVIAILVAMAVSGFKTRHQFIRSQVGAYFLSLVISDLLQAAGSVMNGKWVVIQGVTTGTFCTTQAALKQTGNVGTALWSLVIAIHTFCLLFLRLRIGDRVFYTILLGTWLFIFFIVMLGPLIIQNAENGPFWGISGYWCWITAGYHVEQLTEEYLFMFLTAGTSFVLYSLIFFRLRGNLRGFGWSLRFRRINHPWVEDNEDESQMSIAGKQMLWYPVAYTIIIFPIAACRWSAIFGHEVPYWATMMADSIFMLSGFVNAILYSTTRKIVSIRSLLPFSYLNRIGSSRGDREPETSTSKPYLDDMKFASPMPSPPVAKCGTCQPPIPSKTPRRLWRSRSDNFTVHARLGHSSPPELSKMDSVFEYSKPEKTPRELEGYEPRVEILLSRPSAIPTHERRLQHSHPYTQAQPSAPKVAEADSGVIPRAASETSVTTDGAPSLHRKRFSGWSLPSVRDANSQKSLEGQESLRADLEEMQFAPPSPEPARCKPLFSLHSSLGDLQGSKWPTRSDPL